MFKILTSGCEPTRGSEFSACVDVYSSECIVIGAGETKLVGLGISIDIDELISRVIPSSNVPTEWYKDEVKRFLNSHYLQLMLRSSLGKAGLILPNGVGVIDMDYKDEIKMIIHNPIKNITHEEINTEFGELDHTYSLPFQINKCDRIGQITLLEHKSFLFGIETTATRTGGFGSTN